LQGYRIGKVKGDKKESCVVSSECSIADIKKTLGTLISVKRETSDVIIMTFEILENYHITQFPVGYHVNLHLVSPDWTSVKRPYTPISYKKGIMELLIRIYPDGAASRILSTMKLKHCVVMSLPHGRYNKKEIISKDFVLLISAGTGIAPIFSIVDWLHRRKFSHPIRVLHWHSKAEHLLEEDLSKISRDMVDMKFVYINSNLKGRISEQLLEDAASPEFMSKVTYCAYCGSDGFNVSVRTVLKEIEHIRVLHEFGNNG